VKGLHHTVSNPEETVETKVKEIETIGIKTEEESANNRRKIDTMNGRKEWLQVSGG